MPLGTEKPIIKGDSVMSNSLYELLNAAEKGSVKSNGRGGKKRYFLAHIDVIFKLIDMGVNYSDIIKAIEKDGVSITYQYFVELVSEYKNTEQKKPNSPKHDQKEKNAQGEKTPVTRQVARKSREDDQQFIKELMNRNPLTEKGKK